MRYFLIILLSFITFSAFADLEDFSFPQVSKKIETKEEYYRLYQQWLYDDQDSISRNIYYLELAYVMPFEHPIKALVPMTNQNQYQKYKNLFMMHLCVRLTDEYIRYGYLFMKEHIYFYNTEFFDDYLDGYEIAEIYFKKALEWWEIAKKYSQNADRYSGIRTGLHSMEDEKYKIDNGDLDYEKVIRNLLSRIEKNRKAIQNIRDQSVN